MEGFRALIQSNTFLFTKAACEGRGKGSLEATYGQIAVTCARRYNDKELAEIAVNYFKAAIAKGSVSAMTNLGSVYCYGLPGIKPNKDLAKKYYQTAAENGSNAAVQNLTLL